MSKLDAIIDAYPGEEFLRADGFDEAIIGVDVNSMRLVYSMARMLVILASTGMDSEEAIEYLEFNVLDAYMGEKTPVYVDDVAEEQDDYLYN